MNWMRKASCVGIPTEVFYLEDGQGTADKDIKKICNQCPVQIHCAIAGLAEDHGHWGGASPDTRQQWRRQLRINTLIVIGDEGRYRRYLPMLTKVYADAKTMGIKSAFVSNMQDKVAAVAWLRQTFPDADRVSA